LRTKRSPLTPQMLAFFCCSVDYFRITDNTRTGSSCDRKSV